MVCLVFFVVFGDVLFDEALVVVVDVDWVG